MKKKENLLSFPDFKYQDIIKKKAPDVILVKAEVFSFCWSGVFRCVLTHAKNDLRVATVAAHQSVNSYEAISKLFGVHHSIV